MPSSDVIISDGQTSFSGGVNSIRPPTIQSAQIIDGVGRNELAWLINGTVRDGGITPRSGYRLLGTMFTTLGTFQGGFLYRPLDGNPYFVVSLSGRIYKVTTDNPHSPILLSGPTTTNPADIEQAYFVQGEQFLVIQAGDGVTLPLFWDGTTLRRSIGLNPGGPLVPITTTTTYTFPAIGGSANVDLNPIPAGFAVNDTIGWYNTFGYIATFQITAIVGNTFTLKLLANPIGVVAFTPFNFNWKLISNATRELPAAFAMDYYQGRIWYAQGRKYIAGDIVRNGSSGTPQYDYFDSILKVTENPLAVGGDGFTVPSDAGNIRALKHSANLDTGLGQGLLYIFTRQDVYSLNVPVNRDAWIATTANTQPLQRVAQINNGSVNDRGIITVNGDLFYQTLLPGISSMITAVRNFNQWGNLSLSAREDRVFRFVDRALLHGVSGINTDNRALESTLPEASAWGIVSKGIVPLNFVPVSDFNNAGTVPAWEGLWQGLSILQMFAGDFGGLPRSFAMTLSAANTLDLWEISAAFKSDINTPLNVAQVLTGTEVENRITMVVEFPAYFTGSVFDLKELVGGELWLDRIFGENIITVEYRQDASSCWHMWTQFKVCQPRNSCELVENPVCYPIQQFGESFLQTVTFPKPPDLCETTTGRPAHLGYMFQTRITIKGFSRIRGLLLHATKRDKNLYYANACS
jgi:hypothetical protein